MLKVCIISINKNDARFLRRVLPSWRPFADAIYILDNGSDTLLFDEIKDLLRDEDMVVARQEPTEDLADAFNEVKDWATDDFDVILQVDADEELAGDPATWRDWLWAFADQLEGPGLASFEFKGAGMDPKGRNKRVRAWTDPFFWQFRFPSDCLVFPTNGRWEEVVLAEVPGDVLHFNHLRTSFRKGSQARRRALAERALTGDLDPDDRMFYEGLLAASERLPALSLCTIFQRWDDSLKRLIRSAHEQVEEIVLCATEPIVWREILQWWHDEAVPVDLVRVNHRCAHAFTLADGSSCIGDFAAARNIAFAAASGVWRMFLDSDDELVWQGPSGRAPRLADVVQRHEAYNEISLPYLYQAGSEAPLVTQDRIALFRWIDEDGEPLFRWVHPVHEVARPTVINPGEKTIQYSGETWAIKHHYGPGGQRGERNLHIIERALAEGGLGNIDQMRFTYYKGVHLRDNPATAEEGLALMRLVAESVPTESVGQVACIEVGTTLVERHDHRAAVDVLLKGLASWPGNPHLCLLLMRTYQALGRAGTALRYAHEAYAQPRPASFNYRGHEQEVEVEGRADAVELALQHGQLELARTIWEQAPQTFQKTERWGLQARNLACLRGDFEAAQSFERWVGYQLSLDRVLPAARELTFAPPQIRGLTPFQNARTAVNRRLRHFTLHKNAEILDQLNSGDLVLGGRAHQTFLLERLEGLGPKLVLELGCNTGWLLLEYAARHPEVYCLGLDAGKARVEESLRRAAQRGISDRCTFICAEASPEGLEFLKAQIPLARLGQRPLVVMSEILEHLEHPGLALRAVREILDPGYLLVTVPDVEAYENLMPKARKPGIRPADVSKPLAEGGPEHVNCFEAHDLVRLLAGAELYPRRVERIDIGRTKDDGALLFACATRREPPQVDLLVDIHAEGWVPFGARFQEGQHIGGSEQAIIHLAPELVELGQRVEVWASPIEREDFERDVWWSHAAGFDPLAERDALIIWRRSELLNGARLAAQGRYPVFFWGHDEAILDAGERYALADQVWALSPFHQNQFLAIGVPPEKIAVIQNGVARSTVNRARTAATAPRHPARFIYCSSMDRGLIHLLRMWPQIKEATPAAELHVCYRDDLVRWPGLPPVWARLADTVPALCEALPGVHYHGGLPHQELLELMWTCGAHLYPATFNEVSCIVAMESQACGCLPVTSTRGALETTVLDSTYQVAQETLDRELVATGAEQIGGTWWSPEGADSPSFRAQVLRAAAVPVDDPRRAKLAEEALDHYDWKRTAELVDATMRGLIHGRQHSRAKP